jgi:RNA polymerase sigma factor for flagellar operon FliA
MGTFGLIEAIDRFDLERGVLFKTYCVNRIRGAILDELRALDWVPRLVRHKANTVDRLGGRMHSRLGREATIFEMADELELEVGDYQRIEKDSKPVAMLSLSDESAEGADDGGKRIVDLVRDDRIEDPLRHVHQSDLRDLAKKCLNDKEQVVVALYYFDQLSMKEIAKVLGLTESRICQIHSKVIEKLRRAFERIRCDLFVT